MEVEQFVMAYGVEQDKLRAILPEGFVSLRPVLRINAEVRDNSVGYVEFNMASSDTKTSPFIFMGAPKASPVSRFVLIGRRLPLYSI